MELARTSRTRINGASAAGTESLSGIVELGLASVLNRTTSLDLNVGFGVTPDAPKLRIGIAFPVRLDQARPGSCCVERPASRWPGLD